MPLKGVTRVFFMKGCYVMVILALLPILFLIVALGFLKMAGWKACPIAAIIAFIVAVAVYDMPVPIAISAALEGRALACGPILLVIVMALFAYKLTVATGSLEIIKQMLTTVSEDKRVLFLLIAWGFGTFMEGMAGFGTAVAIPAAMLVALGYPPIKTIVACLISNAVAPSFGSIGIPTTTMAAVTGLDYEGFHRIFYSRSDRSVLNGYLYRRRPESHQGRRNRYSSFWFSPGYSAAAHFRDHRR